MFVKLILPLLSPLMIITEAARALAFVLAFTFGCWMTPPPPRLNTFVVVEEKLSHSGLKRSNCSFLRTDRTLSSEENEWAQTRTEASALHSVFFGFWSKVRQHWRHDRSGLGSKPLGFLECGAINVTAVVEIPSLIYIYIKKKAPSVAHECRSKKNECVDCEMARGVCYAGRKCKVL